MNLGEAFHRVTPELDAIGSLGVGGLHFQRVAAHAELAAPKGDVVALVLQIDQMAQQHVAAAILAHRQLDHHLAPILRIADAVDARHRGHDDHIAPRKQRRGRGQAQPIEFFVDRGIFLDVGIRPRDVGFRLVVVVVRNKVVDGVLREEFLELRIQLRRQRLVVRHDERGPLGALDDLRDGVRFARARSAQQGLIALPLLQAIDQTFNRLRLIAHRLEVGNQFEFLRHAKVLPVEINSAVKIIPDCHPRFGMQPRTIPHTPSPPPVAPPRSCPCWESTATRRIPPRHWSASRTAS